MKRGFLVKAAEKQKAAADRRNRELQTSEQKSTQAAPENTKVTPQFPTRREGRYRVHDMLVTDL